MQWIDIYALLSGLIFVVLEVFHNKWTWPVEILSCIPQLIIFIQASVWGSAGLQAFYIIMAVIGIFTWKSDAEKSDDKDAIVLNRPGTLTFIVSAAAFLGLWAAFYFLFRSTDACPVPDSFELAAGLVGTWWLTRSYIEQWFIWIVADTVQVGICIYLGNIPMTILYVVYLAAAIAGLAVWRRKGIYADATAGPGEGR